MKGRTENKTQKNEENTQISKLEAMKYCTK